MKTSKFFPIFTMLICLTISVITLSSAKAQGQYEQIKGLMNGAEELYLGMVKESPVGKCDMFVELEEGSYVVTFQTQALSQYVYTVDSTDVVAGVFKKFQGDESPLTGNPLDFAIDVLRARQQCPIYYRMLAQVGQEEKFEFTMGTPPGLTSLGDDHTATITWDTGKPEPVFYLNIVNDQNTKFNYQLTMDNQCNLSCITDGRTAYHSKCPDQPQTWHRLIENLEWYRQ